MFTINQVRSDARRAAKARYLEMFKKENIGMSSVYNLYFTISRDNKVLKMFDSFTEARTALHATHAAQYVARVDGAVMAYMSREHQIFRPLARVPIETKKAMFDMANIDTANNREFDNYSSEELVEEDITEE